jgi:hypothetical protein
MTIHWRKQLRWLSVFALGLILCARAVAGPTFYYVVTAVDANGFESAFSNQATAVFNQGNTTATLSWTAPPIPAGGSAIAGYNVYRSTTSGTGYVKINTSLVTTGLTYSDPFVTPNAPGGLAIAVK